MAESGFAKCLRFAATEFLRLARRARNSEPPKLYPRGRGQSNHKPRPKGPNEPRPTIASASVSAIAQPCRRVCFLPAGLPQEDRILLTIDELQADLDACSPSTMTAGSSIRVRWCFRRYPDATFLALLPLAKRTHGPHDDRRTLKWPGFFSNAR